MSHLIASALTTARRILTASEPLLNCQRNASKKAGGSTRNSAGVVRPKHRGVKHKSGTYVQEGALVVLQNKLRFHPGLNVRIGHNGTLAALIPGRVLVTTEKVEPNMEHPWAQKTYGGRDIDRIYKKYFHVLPEPQHYRFKRIG
ncbi:Ribosomal protein L27 [Nesidiocoris tenuis]|uniref:Ribosomal protein L27 n=1 Tax=Nesidiocoris tenuis TaxID=355587 RepID=A0ABN7AQB7_9HEMI|nr:Ribosomal protein L27 [Nesidiocoris tenuis]